MVSREGLLWFSGQSHLLILRCGLTNHIHAAAFTAGGFRPYFCYWARGTLDKSGTWGPNRTLFQSRVPPWLAAAEPGGSPPGQVAPLQASPLAANRSSPLDFGSSCCLWPASHPCQGEPGLPRAGAAGLQAHAVPTEPSARIRSTTGGIRGFGRLITEFTFKAFVWEGERGGLT